MDRKHYEWIEGVRKFIIFLPDIISANEDSIDDLNQLPIKITGKTRDAFKNFYNCYRDSYSLKPYINFKWRNLSTGEKALINIYSRFYFLSNDEVINELNKNLIILIDEGDVYLHPAWQKRFVYLLLNYLPRVYSKTRSDVKRNIQIILTTNSPIPSSDLPNDNTIFLEKSIYYSDDGQMPITKTIVKDSLNDQKETFAANIYTLLTDSFFIKDGFIGEFAAMKINEIIKELTRGSKPEKKEGRIFGKLYIKLANQY